MFILNACTNASFLATVLFIKKLVKIISVIIPVLLVLFVTIDIAKAVVASDDNQIKKAQSIAIKRIIYALIIFFVPILVNAAFNILDNNGVEGLSCYNNAEDEVVEALAQAENESLLKYEEDINKLIEAAKTGKVAKDAELEKLRQKKVSKNGGSSNPTDVKNITKYTKSNGKMAHATSYGKAGRRFDTKKGDQDGKEVTIANLGSFTYIARFKDPSKAEITARCAEAGAANNHIGYSVLNYRSLYNHAKKANWDLSKINKNVDTVCSAFASVCINAAGVKITKDLNGFSYSVKNHLKNTGAFKFYDYKKSSVLRGDILVKAGNHMAIAT